MEKERTVGNHLKDESSPYLLQHKENPVEWYPWCDEAFERARREDKLIFLSIGYSTCHWCHVMAHESFENQEIADILNQHYISVKVDREERPDIDSVYMSVCHALTGSGGWPMSIFMTADQKPVYAGTYFPPRSRAGMPGFRELLLAIAEEWKQRRAGLLQSAESILSHLDAQTAMQESGMNEIDAGLPAQAAESFAGSFDEKYGGFGSAPKFPTPHNLIFLMLYSQMRSGNMPDQVQKTLEQMRRGGIFDQIGYGFSRYSTDRYYLVPHFEKMLYDNALLILAYAAAYKAMGNTMFLETARQTADYVFREMTGRHGEFYSAQDADSEGEEGKFYVWDYGEVCEVLGREKGEAFCSYYGMTRQGNFEGRNIPNLLNGNEITDRFDEERKLLYAYRQSRTKLHLDDKILTAWNSLMICAMTVLYRVTGEENYLAAAERSQRFIEKRLTEGTLLFVSCRGEVRSQKGFLDDYAYYIAALLTLYEATGEETYLRRAEQLCEEARRQFADSEGGGYFLYGTENDRLITRPKETYDGALPGGNSVMAYCLVRLVQITGKESYRSAAEEQLRFLSGAAKDYPAGHSVFLIALLLYENPSQKITAVLADGDDAGEIMRRMPLNAELKFLKKETEGYRLLNGRTTYYVCRGSVCLPPGNQI